MLTGTLMVITTNIILNEEETEVEKKEDESYLVLKTKTKYYIKIIMRKNMVYNIY